MKSFTILVSLIVATAPYGALFAAEEPTSDRATWIEQSLANLKTTSKSSKKHSAAKSTVLHAGVSNTSILTRLQPFVPHKYLPTESELAAQRAQLDSSQAVVNSVIKPAAPLSGQVSTYVAPTGVVTAMIPANGHLILNIQLTPQAVPSNPATVAQALTQAPATAAQTPTTVTRVSTTIARAPVPQKIQNPLAPVIPEPQGYSIGLIRSALNTNKALHGSDANHQVANIHKKLLETNAAIAQLPAQVGGSGDSSASKNNTANLYPDSGGESSVGPPPFPLNLLPEKSLKQLIGSLSLSGTSQHSNAPPSYFGSWHQSSSGSNLSYSGFQSYVRGVSTPVSQLHTNKLSNTPHSYITSKHSSQHKKQTHQVAKSVKPQQIAVRMYPVYERTLAVSF